MDLSKLIFGVSITVFGMLGSYLPVWLANSDPLGGASILGGFIGSLVGIWAAVVARNYLG